MMKMMCRDVRTLADYIEGGLSDEEKEQVEEHLSRCDDCLEEFVFAHALLNDSELTETEYELETASASFSRDPFEKLKKSFLQKISGWMSELTVPFWLGQYEPVRSDMLSEPSSMLIKKNINNYQTEIFIRQEKPDKARIWIRASKDKKLARNISLTLIREGEIPFARVLNRDYVCFERQPFGSFCLAVGHDEAALENTYCFELSSAGFYEKQYPFS